MDRLPENIAVKKRSWTEWKKFAQKVDLFLRATKKTNEEDDTKIAILLATGGDIVLDEFNAKYGSSDKPEYEEVVKTLGLCFADGESEHYLSHMFRERIQRPGEPAAEWITDLRLKVKVCNYGGLADRMIRDQIIYGVSNKETRRELLKVSKLSADEAVRICLAMETSRSQLKAFEQQTERQTGDTQSLNSEEESNALQHFSRSRKKPSRSRPQQNGAFGNRYQNNQQRSFRNERPSQYMASKECRACGRTHPNNTCPAKGRACSKCGRMNHFATMCYTGRAKINTVDGNFESDEDFTEEEVQWVCAIKASERMVYVTMQVSEANSFGKATRFQVDCGATCNIIPRHMIPNATINTGVRPPLKAYNRSTIKTLGTTDLRVRNIKTKMEHEIKCVVVEDKFQPIIGRFTAEKLNLIHIDYEQVDSICHNETFGTIENVMKAFPNVFDGGLGKFPGKVKLHLKKEAIPCCNVACRVSPHLKVKLLETLKQLKGRGIIRKVEEPTEWVNRISIQIKKTGQLRLCLDPRRLNEYLVREVYHTPALDEILPDLSGAKVFSKFDLSDGFWQCELEESSRHLTTFQTPFGRFQWQRLPFGLNVAPEIFYKRLVQCLEGLENTYALADDVLICGRGNTHDEARMNHDENLQRFLKRCSDKGIKLNRKKATLRATGTKFFGFVLTDRGIQMDPEKQQAITRMKEPGDIVALKSFLGMLSHVARFMPRGAEIVAPLRELCKDGGEWIWTERQQESFKRATKMIS
ncbi:uncharacterized protein LOC100906147 [Galendromus occidentalis]|uniref:Uncharacterized protein LOC100906147 n=1 Tax=Galendromus occidentalis TaxID=34638 RepID=A0AAJ6VV76_9ACAR|nr:uncharacterized protein LOC100906147 [Galendromus occidentalis]